MLVMILETVPVGLRGELTRWLIEPHPGVFVGHVSGLVRDRLWLKCCQGMKNGGIVQIWSTNNEQRFQMRAVRRHAARCGRLRGAATDPASSFDPAIVHLRMASTKLGRLSHLQTKAQQGRLSQCHENRPECVV